MQTDRTPLISIITPVYNVERYLPQCIESVISQTFQEWELILVDDGSTDKSGNICDEYAKRDHRIRVIHKTNSGQADSRNIALNAARAQIIGFVDSDDWIEPNMYTTLYNTMTEYNADIAICGYSLDYKNKVEKINNMGETTVYDQAQALNLILGNKVIKSFLWDKLYKRKVIQELPPKSYFYEDYSTLFKWFTHATGIAFIQQSLYHYRLRKSSTDNVKDPLKKYHFFLAELERYNFLHKHHILPQEDEKAFASKVIETAITESKCIARYSHKKKEAIHYIHEIVKCIQPLLPISCQELGFMKYYRLWEIQHLQSWFVWYMQISNIFSYKHKTKNLNYFD